jgi:hypothetical protein
MITQFSHFALISFLLLYSNVIPVQAKGMFAVEGDSIKNVLLGEVSVVSRIEKLNSENNVVKIDSSVMQAITGESLSDLLSKHANVSIKSYGVSGISSLSIRGGGTSHTAVVWNGFNLQDQLNGGFNFALAPAFIADNIDVKYGGSSAIYGSGAMGGTISMSSTPFLTLLSVPNRQFRSAASAKRITGSNFRSVTINYTCRQKDFTLKVTTTSRTPTGPSPVFRPIRSKMHGLNSTVS